MSINFVAKAQSWQTIALSIVAGSASYLCLGMSTITQSVKPRVVATTSVTKQIAQDTIDLTCLIDAGSDPHTYQPKPADRLAIEKANLVLYAGYNFEPSIIKLITAASIKPPSIAVNELAVPLAQQFEDDGETVNDPHVFHNARNGSRIAEIIGARLSQLQPSKSALYKANTKKLSAELLQIDSWIKRPFPLLSANW